MNKSDLARRLKISRRRLYQLMERGMPVISVAAAQKWRKEQASMRLPPDSPLMKPADQQRNSRGKERSKPVTITRTGDPMEDQLAAARMIQQKAHEMVIDAMNGEEFGRIPSLIAVHNKALEAAMDTEKAYREELERRDVLVPKMAILESCRRCLDAVLRRLKKLPMEQGPQCNPQEPLMATTILEREINEIIAVGQRALKGL